MQNHKEQMRLTMKKILFVTDRNILTTSGELRLIKNRAESLFNESGIITDFIVFAKKERAENRNEEINAGGDLTVYEVSLSKPLSAAASFFKVRKEIEKRLKTNEYRTVVLSGPVMVSYAKRIKRDLRIPVIADIHGSFEDMVVFAKTSPFVKRAMLRLSYHLEKYLLKRNTKYLDGFFVVTEALKRYITENYPVNNNMRYFIIPCATNTDPSDAEEYRNDRKKYREKYGIQEDEIVFVYSGGVSPWQCVDRSIWLFRKIADCLEVQTRMLVFSHRREAVEALTNGDSRILIDSYPPDELLHVLHAGDFAFLLRENCVTNNVAFPNKFLEYVHSGMRIITTPYIEEIAKQVSGYDLGYIYDFNEDIRQLTDYIQNVDIHSYREKDIDKVLTENSFANTTRDFRDWYLMGNEQNSRQQIC